MEDNELCLVASREKFAGLIEYVKKAADGTEAIHKVEYHLFRLLLSLGYSLLVYFIKQKGLGDVGRYLSLNSGQILLRHDEVKKRRYLTIFGEVEIFRYVYGQGADQQAPLDAKLQLPAWKYSYLLQDWGLCFSSGEAFSEAGKILEKILGIRLCVRSLERLSCKVSDGVESFREDHPVPEADAEEIVVATSDCKGVPLKKQQPAASKRRRRKKGEKPNKKKMACVGGVYSIAPFVRTAEDIMDEVQNKESKTERPGPSDKQLRADLIHEKQTTFAWLADQVKKRNPEGALPVVCLMDGERALWRLKAKYLPDAVGILDLWHVSEYLWKGAYCFHEEGAIEAQKWVDKRLNMLLYGNVAYVIAGIKQMITKQALKGKKKKTLWTLITYFTNNRAYMQYDQYLAAGYPIGSGVAEGACRHLVKDRMERTGMRWTLEGGQAILDLRASYINGDWDAFWTHYTTAEKKRLYGQLNTDNKDTYRATG